jgi:hypothetical protein
VILSYIWLILNNNTVLNVNYIFGSLPRVLSGIVDGVSVSFHSR